MDDFFNVSEFAPRGQSFLWRPEILWLHFVSDLVAAIALFAIPVTLVYILAKNHHSYPNRWILYMFAALIALCALGHVVSIITLWKPIYFVEGLLKAAMASVAFSTGILFIPLAPRFMGLTGLRKNDEK